jgi:CubicO group peptidase (beta-lactamase class C family)
LRTHAGWIDYDARVAEYWPEFARNGKDTITVRRVLSHEAGLVWIDESLRFEDLRDLDYAAAVLARQTPAWEPGTRHGYHAMTIGLYMQELIRHVDPAHRTLGRFFHEEIARPLQIEFYIGLPPEIPDERLAQLRTFSLMRGIAALRMTPIEMVRQIGLAAVAAAKLDAVRRPRPQRSSRARGRDPGGQRRGDRAGLFGIRRGRSRARHHPGDLATLTVLHELSLEGTR